MIINIDRVTSFFIKIGYNNAIRKLGVKNRFRRCFMKSAEEALKILIEGNRQYSSEHSIYYDELDRVRRQTYLAQEPIAVIIGCSDSRVPVEIIFNCKPGDLFVVRIAGNVLNVDIIGSVEYAIKYLGVNLVLVLGHSNCGVFNAALSNDKFSFELKGLIDKVRSAVYRASAHGDDIREKAIKGNVIETARDVEEICHRFTADYPERKIGVAGAYYDLGSGKVEIIRPLEQND
jgi:carbonic anhydrase